MVISTICRKKTVCLGVWGGRVMWKWNGWEANLAMCARSLSRDPSLKFSCLFCATYIPYARFSTLSTFGDRLIGWILDHIIWVSWFQFLTIYTLLISCWFIHTVATCCKYPVMPPIPMEAQHDMSKTCEVDQGPLVLWCFLGLSMLAIYTRMPRFPQPHSKSSKAVLSWLQRSVVQIGDVL